LRAGILAGRVLERTVAQSLAHPTIAEVEQSLRAALGDPLLRLGFRIPSGRLVDSRGRELEAPPPASRRRLTAVARDGVTAAAVVHDVQLEDDPELLLAAGAAALLMFENARLEAELGGAVHELRTSRGAARQSRRPRAATARTRPARRGPAAARRASDQGGACVRPRRRRYGPASPARP